MEKISYESGCKRGVKVVVSMMMMMMNWCEYKMLSYCIYWPNYPCKNDWFEATPCT